MYNSIENNTTTLFYTDTHNTMWLIDIHYHHERVIEVKIEILEN